MSGTTTDPNDPRLGRGSDTERKPQNEVYLVLSDEERAQGFVRPLRDSYQHVGRSVCGKPRQGIETDNPAQPYICVMLPGHEGDCAVFHKAADIGELERAGKHHLLGGCNGVTRMGYAIAATYARQPDFYGATYCVDCQMHRPVGEAGEFVWLGTTERVGT